MYTKLEEKIETIKKLIADANLYAESIGENCTVTLEIDYWENSDAWEDSGCEWSSSSEEC